MVTGHARTSREALLACFTALLTLIGCGAVCVAAVLAPAPAAALPVVVLVCIGFPMLAALELPGAFSALNAGRGVRDAEALAQFRRSLDELPETNHPLDA